MKAWYDIKKGVPGLRLAVPADEDQIFGLLLMLHGENGHFTMNHNKVIDGIRIGTNREGGLIFVNEGPRIVASLAVVLTQDWYSDDVYLLERWNYVHPDYRRTDYARKLVEQAKWCAENFSRIHGRNLVLQVGITSCIRTEAKVRLYARHMACIGAYFMYGEPPVQAAAEKIRAEMAAIDELNERNQRPTPIRPVVETIIRLSRSA